MLRIRPETTIYVEYAFSPEKNLKLIGRLALENTLDEELSLDEDFMYGLIEECWRDYGWDGHLYDFEAEVWITFEVF